jgi:hypothetical protein
MTKLNIQCDSIESVSKHRDNLVVEINVDNPEPIIEEILDSYADWVKDFMLDKIGKKYIEDYFGYEN